MHVEITNMGTLTMPLTSTDGEGVVAELPPSASWVIDDTTVTVATFGDDPGFVEEVTEGFDRLVDAVRRAINRFRHHQASAQAAGTIPGLVVCRVENFGPHALRLILGADNTDDHELASGETTVVQTIGYVEIRELGVSVEPVSR